jgi:2-methylcitrate dehydratase PrpD
MGITQKLADFVAGLDLEDMPPRAVEATKSVILDTLGSALAGTSAEGISILRGLSEEWAGAPQSTIWGFDQKVPAPQAALVNGVASRARDIDEVHEVAVMHSGASVVPACLAVAEWTGGIAGRELIPAVAGGIDIMTRLGVSLERQPNLSGISSTWHLGVFGAAAAAGRLLGLDEQGILDALGIANCLAAGTQQAITEGTLMVRVMQGITAQSGLMAAILASRGVNGPHQALEGGMGYFAAYHGNRFDPAAVTNGLGERFEVSNCSIKPFPCCKVIHSAAAGALEIGSRHHLDPGDIEEITVRVNKAADNLVCQPLESKKRPSSIPDAQFSLPYCVAVALAKGDLFLNDFTPQALQNKQVLGLAEKIQVKVDPEIERLCGREIGFSQVEVRVSGQGVLTARVERVKGNPLNPMTGEEVEEKFHKCAALAARTLAPEALDKIAETVRRLEDCPDTARLAELLH